MGGMFLNSQSYYIKGKAQRTVNDREDCLEKFWDELEEPAKCGRVGCRSVGIPQDSNDHDDQLGGSMSQELPSEISIC